MFPLITTGSTNNISHILFERNTHITRKSQNNVYRTLLSPSSIQKNKKIQQKYCQTVRTLSSKQEPRVYNEQHATNINENINLQEIVPRWYGQYTVLPLTEWYHSCNTDWHLHYVYETVYAVTGTMLAELTDRSSLRLGGVLIWVNLINWYLSH